MLVPVVLGADKTTCSVATGHQSFHPVYMSLGNIHNEMRHAHRDALVPIAFLPIPTCEYDSLDVLNALASNMDHRRPRRFR